MDDLIAWLRRQIGTDEALAKTAFGAHNDAGPEWTEIWSGTVDTGDEQIGCFDSGLSRHIVNMDPARVLREVEAKREIVNVCAAELGGNVNPSAMGNAEFILQLMGAPYSDRPDYREDWKP